MPRTALRSDTDGRVRILTLARPQVRNALDDALVAELRAAVADASDDDAVRAVVLAGDGPAFCSGLDLAALGEAASGPMERHRASARSLAELYRALLLAPKPILAAVAGPAVAGGAGLVLAADVAVMAPDARIGFTEARLGFVPALVGVLLARHVGEKAARSLLLGADPVDGRRALALGLVTELAEDPLPRALELARRIAGNAPTSIAETKRLLATTHGLGLDDALRVAADVNAAARATEALRMGVAAYLADEPPPWSD